MKRRIERIMNAPIFPSHIILGLADKLALALPFYKLNPWARQKRRRFLADFTLSLMSICRKGMPVSEGVAALALDYGSDYRGAVLQDIAEQLDQGHAMSFGWWRHPGYFPPVYCRILEAGELSGNLTDTLAVIHDSNRYEYARCKRILSALAYPTLLILVLGVIYSFLFIYVMPRFVDMYAQMGSELPWLTREVDYFISHIWSTAFSVILLFFGAVLLGGFLLQLEFIRGDLGRLVSKAPAVGSLFWNRSREIFCRSMKLLLERGISLPEAFRLSGESVPSYSFRNRVLWALPDIERGESLATVLSRHRLVRQRIVWQLRLGGERENLPQALGQIAEYLFQKQDYRLQLLLMIEPALVLCIGIIHAFVVVALYLPILNITAAMGHFADFGSF